MHEWALPVASLLWRAALSAVPLVLLVAAICRWMPSRPATRHVLWLTVLLWFVVGPLVPGTHLAGPSDPTSLTPASEAPSLESLIPKRELLAAPSSPAMVPPLVARTEPRVPAWLALATGSGGRSLGTDQEQAPDAAAGSPSVRAAPPKPVHRKPLTDTNAGLVQAPDNPDGMNGRGKGSAAHAASQTPVEPPFVGLAERAWLWVATAHAAMRSVPKVPTSVWVTGVLLVTLLGVVRLGRAAGRLRCATPAPQSVQRMAVDVGATLGLSRPPEVLMVEASVSPMIWCGRRTRLILPKRLWVDLDPAGRRAVMCHELAHLRRRDHWVRWLELAVSVVYWWHPLVWWVRRRLHDEADLCCDVWVTWLMPRGRRAYAEALLTAKRFVSVSEVPVPAVGMAVTSGRARPLARRLTMVMTRSFRPQLSASGLVLAAALATAGWVATPALSSPPTEPSPPTVSVVALEPPYLLVGDDDDLDTRMARLEKHMQKLADAMDELVAAMDDDGRERGRRTRKARPPRAPRAPRAPRSSRALGEAAKEYVAQALQGETMVRKYELPAGKLEALTELMVRDDVPILVRPLDDGIEVRAPAVHQAVFEAFVNMIHPAEEAAAPPDQGTGSWFKTLTDAAALGDVLKSRPAGTTAKKVRDTLSVRGVRLSARADEARKRALAKTLDSQACERNQRSLLLEIEELRRQADLFSEQALLSRQQLATQALETKDSQTQCELKARELDERAKQHRDKARKCTKKVKRTDKQAKKLEQEARDLEVEAQQS